jgi:excinuclease UvrABC nuclease subunit
MTLITIPHKLKYKLKFLPKSPGVYQFIDKHGKILYIGKAKNLRSRVRQYFAGTDERHQIPFLMEEAVDFNYTLVNTELESLYLERSLIQTHKPKYNIDLRDDKNYAFLVFDYSTPIPQIVIKRKLQEANFQFSVFNFQSNQQSVISPTHTSLTAKHLTPPSPPPCLPTRQLWPKHVLSLPNRRGLRKRLEF